MVEKSKKVGTHFYKQQATRFFILKISENEPKRDCTVAHFIYRQLFYVLVKNWLFSVETTDSMLSSCLIFNLTSQAEDYSTELPVKNMYPVHNIEKEKITYQQMNPML